MDMNWFKELLMNPFLIAGISGWFVAQVVKTILYAIINKKLVWERMVGDGGMPSGHSATVTAMCIMSMLVYGPGSYEFAISAILAIIVCHDAMGVRRETGKQAQVINELLRFLESGREADMKELVGHTPVQVWAGILIGILNALLLFEVLI